MDTLISSNIHIQSIINLMDTKIVEVLIMDVNNTQNTKKIIDNIITACIVLRNIFDDTDIEFKFKLVMWDDIAKDNIKSRLGKIEKFKDMNYVREKLSSYKIEGRNVLLDLGIDIDDMRISIVHLDFYKQYLENIKFVNTVYKKN